ncbi:LacI family DNA-binding transcriptional regulator [Microbacterium invictum]|uniref:LacI family transcriptional regulator n=1 Tax=Microbacterium invictum TaxID=515415 RepID=A0AA40VNU8_9MICO|nr:MULTISPECIES: LacI family DNA-binding transcriptional regulator [Microbacterium]MBB4141197.1 LacI family transcriptional regulator [Microbacterium invictum]
MAKKSPRVTITDVARTAGVSLSTVSRVMNDNPTVDPALAERVRGVATDLGYTANPLARSLVLGRTQTVAVVIPDLANPTFQAILRGLSRAADDDGYHVLIADSAEQVEKEPTLATTTRRRTDGVILCAPRMSQDELTAMLPALAPAVIVNRPPQPGAPTVAADYRSAMTELVAHLYELGHRRVAFLSGVPGSASGAARKTAQAEARIAHADLEIVEFPAGVDFDSGAQAAGPVLAASVTAVLAFNDLVAMGLLSAVTAQGVRVPEDLSIAGFDDIPFARFTSPPLTTAAVPAAELGRRAWAAMSALLSGDAAATSLVLTPEIVVRGSTGPAPAS